MPILSELWPWRHSPRPQSQGASPMFTVRALSSLLGQGIPNGQKQRGETFMLDRDKAFELAAAGSVEILEGDDLRQDFETKGDALSDAVTTDARGSSSPAVLPPVPQTSPSPMDGRSSRSMTATGSRPAAKLSTRRTTAGGSTTTRKPAGRTLKPRDGVRTAKHVGTLVSASSNPSDVPDSPDIPTSSTPE